MESIDRHIVYFCKVGMHYIVLFLLLHKAATNNYSQNSIDNDIPKLINLNDPKFPNETLTKAKGTAKLYICVLYLA